MDGVPTEENLASRRDRSIRLAVATSFLSKFGTIFLQLVSIPLAVRVLGREEFGLYTMVNLTLSTLALLQVGVGPALAHGLSRARAEEDEKKQRELGSTAFFLVAGVAMVAGVLLAAVLSLVPMGTLYGEDFAAREAALRPALWVGLGLCVALFVLNLTERVREGYLEVAANNVWGAAGNFAGALCVGAGIWFVPEVWFLVLAVHGTMVLAKLGNTFALWRRRPLMRPAMKAFRGGTARHLFSDGLAFSTCCVVTGIVEYNFCGWLVGRMEGTAEVALYGVFITLTVMQLGFVVMLSTPTWPAVAEALARGDLPWARKAAGKLYAYGTAFVVCSAVGLTAVGPFVLRWWLGEEFGGIGRGILACYGFYFVAHVWRHLNHMMMIGTGQVGRLVGIQLGESLAVAAVAWVALEYGSMAWMLGAMAVTIFAMTGWFLPGKVAGVLRAGRSER